MPGRAEAGRVVAMMTVCRLAVGIAAVSAVAGTIVSLSVPAPIGSLPAPTTVATPTSVSVLVTSPPQVAVIPGSRTPRGGP